VKLPCQVLAPKATVAFLVRLTVRCAFLSEGIQEVLFFARRYDADGFRHPSPA